MIEGARLGKLVRWFTAVSVLAMLSACTSVEFEGTENRLAIFPAQVDESDPQPVGGTVIWGGRIIDVYNGERETELLVLAYPLSRGHVPLLERETVGRFVTVYPGYLEPLEYAAGRYVSVAGDLSGFTDAWSRDGAPGSLPVVRSTQVHLWPRDPSSWRSRIRFGIAVSGGF